MVDALVEYEYSSKEEDELCLKVGDVITNVKKMDGGWWEGELAGKRGVFPDNFVKEIKKEDKKSTEPPPIAKKEGRSHVAELANKLGRGGGIKVGQPMPVVMRKTQDPDKKKIRAKVTFSYSPENEDELKLEVGETVDIIKQEEEGWWEAALNGKTGMIPSNFVEIVDGSADIVDHNEDIEVKEIQAKKVKGIGLGNIFSEGPIKLRSTAATKEPKAEARTDLHKEPIEAKRASTRNAPQVPRDAPTSATGDAKAGFSDYASAAYAHLYAEYKRRAEQVGERSLGFANDQYSNFPQSDNLGNVGTVDSRYNEGFTSDFMAFSAYTDLLPTEFVYQNVSETSDSHSPDSVPEMCDNIVSSSLSGNVSTNGDSRHRDFSSPASESALAADGGMLCENLCRRHNEDTESSDGDLSLIVNCASRDLESCNSRGSIETDSLDIPAVEMSDAQVHIDKGGNTISDAEIKQTSDSKLEMLSGEGKMEMYHVASMDGSGDMPVILTALGRALQTPPPKPSFRKRRSLSTPKHSTPRCVKRQKLQEDSDGASQEMVEEEKEQVMGHGHTHDEHIDKTVHVTICTRDLIIDTESSDSLETDKSVRPKYAHDIRDIHVLKVDKLNDSMELTRRKLSTCSSDYRVSPKEIIGTKDQEEAMLCSTDSSMTSDRTSRGEDDMTQDIPLGPIESLSSTPEKLTCLKFPRLLKCFLPWNSKKRDKDVKSVGSQAIMNGLKLEGTDVKQSSTNSIINEQEICDMNDVCKKDWMESGDKSMVQESKVESMAMMNVEDLDQTTENRETYLQHLYSTGRLTPTIRSLSDKYGLLNSDTYKSRRSSILSPRPNDESMMFYSPVSYGLQDRNTGAVNEGEIPATNSNPRLGLDLSFENTHMEHDEKHAKETQKPVIMCEAKTKRKNKWSQILTRFRNLKLRNKGGHRSKDRSYTEYVASVPHIQICYHDSKQDIEEMSNTSRDRLELDRLKKDQGINESERTDVGNTASSEQLDTIVCEVENEEKKDTEGDLYVNAEARTDYDETSSQKNLDDSQVDVQPDAKPLDLNENNSSANLLRADATYPESSVEEFEKWLSENMSGLAIRGDNPWAGSLPWNNSTPDSVSAFQEQDLQPAAIPDIIATECPSDNKVTFNQNAHDMQNSENLLITSQNGNILPPEDCSRLREDMKQQWQPESEESNAVSMSEQAIPAEGAMYNASSMISPKWRELEERVFSPGIRMKQQYVERIWIPSSEELGNRQHFFPSQSAGAMHTSTEHEGGFQMDAEDGLVTSCVDNDDGDGVGGSTGGMASASDVFLQGNVLNNIRNSPHRAATFDEDPELSRQRDHSPPEVAAARETAFIDDVIKSCVFSSISAPYDPFSERDSLAENSGYNELQLLQKSMDDDEYCIDYDGSLLIDDWNRDQSTVAGQGNGASSDDLGFERQEKRINFQFERRPTFVSGDFLNDCLEVIENPTNFICAQQTQGSNTDIHESSQGNDQSVDSSKSSHLQADYTSELKEEFYSLASVNDEMT